MLNRNLQGLLVFGQILDVQPSYYLNANNNIAMKISIFGSWHFGIFGIWHFESGHLGKGHFGNWHSRKNTVMGTILAVLITILVRG